MSHASRVPTIDMPKPRFLGDVCTLAVIQVQIAVVLAAVHGALCDAALDVHIVEAAT